MGIFDWLFGKNKEEKKKDTEEKHIEKRDVAVTEKESLYRQLTPMEKESLRRKTINMIADAINSSKKLRGILGDDAIQNITMFIENKETFLQTLGEEGVILLELQILLEIYLDICISHGKGNLSDQEFKKIGLATWQVIDSAILVIDDYIISQEWKRYKETSHTRNSIDHLKKIDNRVEELLLHYK